MTDKKRGNSVCILLRRARSVQDETYEIFTPIEERAEDKAFAQRMAEDGMMYGPLRFGIQVQGTHPRLFLTTCSSRSEVEGFASWLELSIILGMGSPFLLLLFP